MALRGPIDVKKVPEIPTGRGLPVRISPTGKIASPSPGETVQPGTKFKPFDRRDVVYTSVGPGIIGNRIKEPPFRIIHKVVVPTNDRGPAPSPSTARGRTLPQKEPAIPTIQIKRPQMGLNLGDIFGGIGKGLDIYDRYKNIRRGPVTTPMPVPGTGVRGPTIFPGEGFGVDLMPGGPTYISDPGGGIPGFDVISEPPTDDPKGWVYKKSCGEWKWVKPARRRRRKLLTDSDYNGLLKLQTLKVNSNMNIAIAKSIGR